MSRDLFIKDTAKVFLKSLVTGNIVGIGYAQTGNLEFTEEQNEVRGAIGNVVAYTLKSAKSINIQITSATFKPEFFAITQGTEFKDNVSREMIDNVFLKVKKNSEDKLELELPTNLSSLTTVRVEDVDGVQQDLAVISGKVELPSGFEAKEGDELEVFYLKEVTGRVLEFDAGKYPTKFLIQMQTLCYDRETEEVYSDIYFVFDEASPSSAMTVNLQNGEAFIPELNFTVTSAKGTGVLGRKYEVLRK